MIVHSLSFVGQKFRPEEGSVHRDLCSTQMAALFTVLMVRGRGGMELTASRSFAVSMLPPVDRNSL